MEENERHIHPSRCIHLHWGYYLAASALPLSSGIAITLLIRLIIFIRKRSRRKNRIRRARKAQEENLSQGDGNRSLMDDNLNNSASFSCTNSGSLASDDMQGKSPSRLVRSKAFREGTIAERFEIAFARTQLFCEMLESGEATYGKVFVCKWKSTLFTLGNMK